VATHALNRDLVLAGFMGAGKTTIGVEVARRLGRELVDTDDALDASVLVHDEAAYRAAEAATVRAALASKAAVIAVGGGAVETPEVRELLRDEVVVVLDVDVETAWERTRGSDRPLVQDESEFRRRFELRRALYDEVADARAQDADGVVPRSRRARRGRNARASRRVHRRPAALVTEPVVNGIHGADAQLHSHSPRNTSFRRARRRSR
jgi:shikimate kinase